jgi:hypothetical protein
MVSVGVPISVPRCGTKLAVTVQLAATIPVVYVGPESVPPQPVTLLTA